MHSLDALPGPDFLESIADQEMGNGNEINAGAFRDRARQWRAEQVSAAALEAENAALAERVTALEARSGNSSRGAVTPTDSRA